ncbi:MAG: hypothetical protein IT307_20400 [Chloroflexi bacterium]|nr:hypothetical protein [Chloroflexota bacterium]
MERQANGPARVLALTLFVALALLGSAACAPSQFTPLVPSAPGAPAPIAPRAPLGAQAPIARSLSGHAGAVGEPGELLFVIPAGTFAAEVAGEPSFSLPPTIPVVVGQTIAIRNNDQAMHYFFDAPIAPGQTVRKAFLRPGSYSYSPGLSCSLAKGAPITVKVQSP